MRARTERRIKDNAGKLLYDIVVEYVWMRSQPLNSGRKDDLFKEYDQKWKDLCFQKRNNKLATYNSKGFQNTIGTIKQVRQFQRSLGLPEERLTLWQRLFNK